jgi:hypothetical protein
MLSLILVGMYLYRTTQEFSQSASTAKIKSTDRLSMHKPLQMVLPYFAPIAVIMMGSNVFSVFLEARLIFTVSYTFQIYLFSGVSLLLFVVSVISLKKLLHIAESTQNAALQTYANNLKVCVKLIYLSVSSSLGITFLNLKSMTFRPFPLFAIVLLRNTLVCQPSGTCNSVGNRFGRVGDRFHPNVCSVTVHSVPPHLEYTNGLCILHNHQPSHHQA